jgi:hypothetical protein
MSNTPPVASPESPCSSTMKPASAANSNGYAPHLRHHWRPSANLHPQTETGSFYRGWTVAEEWQRFSLTPRTPPHPRPFH